MVHLAVRRAMPLMSTGELKGLTAVCPVREEIRARVERLLLELTSATAG